MENETPSTIASSETPEQNEPASTNETPKTYTQDEYDRYGQSQASKGKNELLKSMGVTSVQEVIDMRANLDRYKAESTEKDTKISDLSKQVEDANNNAHLTKLGVADEHFEDVLILAKAKMADGETIAQAIEKVVATNPQWTVAKTAKVGATEGSTATESEDPVKEGLAKKYPWLK